VSCSSELRISIFSFVQKVLHVFEHKIGRELLRFGELYDDNICYRCSINKVCTVVTETAIILPDPYQYSFHATRIYSCLPKVVVLTEV
jgi:hypothetical protein